MTFALNPVPSCSAATINPDTTPECCGNSSVEALTDCGNRKEIDNPPRAIAKRYSISVLAIGVKKNTVARINGAIANNRRVEYLRANNAKRTLPNATNPQKSERPRDAFATESPPSCFRKTEPQLPKVAYMRHRKRRQPHTSRGGRVF